MTVKIIPNETSNPPGKLADAELHFTTGTLTGLKLVGFSIWERKGGGDRQVVYRDAERRSLALLRALFDSFGENHLRDAILEAYVAHEQGSGVQQ